METVTEKHQYCTDEELRRIMLKLKIHIAKGCCRNCQRVKGSLFNDRDDTHGEDHHHININTEEAYRNKVLECGYEEHKTAAKKKRALQALKAIDDRRANDCAMLVTTAAMSTTLPTIDVPYTTTNSPRHRPHTLPSMFVRHCAARVCAKRGM